MGAGAALCLTWLVKLGVCTAATFYPLRGQLWRLSHFFDISELYTVANSNLDVWLLAVLQSVVVGALLTQAVAPRRRFSGLVVAPPYTKVSRAGRLESRQGKKGGQRHAAGCAVGKGRGVGGWGGWVEWHASGDGGKKGRAGLWGLASLE